MIQILFKEIQKFLKFNFFRLNLAAGKNWSYLFLFPSHKISLICLEGKIMTPHLGNTFFSFVYPSNSLISQFLWTGDRNLSCRENYQI